MYSKLKNVTIIFIKVLVIYFISSQQFVSSHPIANKTGKSHINRKNDRFYQYFNKNFDELSNHGSELRHSIDKRTDQMLNISITVAEPYNEFTELQTQQPIDSKEILTKNDCHCSCDPYLKANQLINEYILSDDEDPTMDIDDNEELERLKKPYKYIPMETIELAHQRPQRVTSTPTPPSVQQKFTNLVQSMNTYLSFPKFSTTDYLELGVSLVVTGVLGFLGLSSLNPYQTFFRRNFGLSDRNQGYYNKFYSRQFNDTEDAISMIYDWIKKFE